MSATMERRNIIILGSSGHGKSTFLQSLLEMQGLEGEAEQIAIGSGTGMSCTMESSMVHLHEPGEPTRMLRTNPIPNPTLDPNCELIESQNDQVQMDEYRRKTWEQRKLLDFSGQFAADVECATPLVVGENHISGPVVGFLSIGDVIKAAPPASALLCGVATAAASCAAEGMSAEAKAGLFSLASCLSSMAAAVAVGGDRVADPPQLQVVAMDTPGLEDARGWDDAHVANIIESVIENQTLSSIVMVINFQATFTENWRKGVLRYWRLFPMLQSQWIFIHTRTDPYALSNKAFRKSSSYESRCQEVATTSTNIMRDLTEDKDFSAAHIFVENDFDGKEVLRAVMAQQQNAFYAMIANFKPVRIDHLHYEKGPELQKVDDILLSAVDFTILAVTNTLLQTKHELAELMRQRSIRAEQAQISNARLYQIQSDLFDMDNDGVNLISTTVSSPWGFFRYPRAQAKIQSLHPNYNVTVTDISGWTPHVLEEVGRTVVDLQDGTKIITIDFIVKFVFTSLHGNITVSSSKRDVYAARIHELRQQEREERERILREMDMEKREDAMVESKQVAKTFLEKQHETCVVMKQFLKMPWNLSIYRSMKPFYDFAVMTKDLDHRELMRGFQSAWEVCYRERQWLDFEPVPIDAPDSSASR